MTEVDEVRQVAPDHWHDAVAAAHDEGFTTWSVLTAVDEVGRADALRVVCRVRRPGSSGGLQLHVLVARDAPRLASVVDVFAGAAWYQREVHDMFGVVFDGAPIDPLLNHDESLRPLRKDVVLAARTAVPWPGAKEPGESGGAPSRRKMVPPGVPDAAVWGDRDPATPAPSADEVAAAVAGGRVRRRR